MNDENKINQSISRSGFIGFVVMLMITFVMEFVLGGEEPVLYIPPWVKFIIYGTTMCIVVIVGVDKPEVGRFMATIKQALEDGVITATEAMAIIRQGWFVYQGWWADITQIANTEDKRAKKEKKRIIKEEKKKEKIPETELET